MENSSHTESFVLALYRDTGRLTPLYFLLSLLLYLVIIVTNAAVIVTVCMHRALHQPMYMLMCCLFANEIYGSTAMFPCLMLHILSHTHHISVSFCFLQIFNFHSYVAVEFGTLTLMAYDRYVCICRPLHYHRVMCRSSLQTALVLVWLLSFVEVGLLVLLSVHSSFCGRVIDQIFCDSHLVMKLACSPNMVLSFLHDVVFGLIFTVVAPLIFILFSYSRIMHVCLRASADTKRKAFQTCTPHLVLLIFFVAICFINIITQRVDWSSVPLELRAMQMLLGQVLPNLLSPMVYAVQLSSVRGAVRKGVPLKLLRQ